MEKLCPICKKPVKVSAEEAKGEVSHMACLEKIFQPIRQKMLDNRKKVSKIME